jgi:hypothetical protein
MTSVDQEINSILEGNYMEISTTNDILVIRAHLQKLEIQTHIITGDNKWQLLLLHITSVSREITIIQEVHYMEIFTHTHLLVVKTHLQKLEIQTCMIMGNTIWSF